MPSQLHILCILMLKFEFSKLGNAYNLQHNVERSILLYYALNIYIGLNFQSVHKVEARRGFKP